MQRDNEERKAQKAKVLAQFDSSLPAALRQQVKVTAVVKSNGLTEVRFRSIIPKEGTAGRGSAV